MNLHGGLKPQSDRVPLAFVNSVSGILNSVKPLLLPSKSRIASLAHEETSVCQVLGLFADPNGFQPPDDLATTRAESRILELTSILD